MLKKDLNIFHLVCNEICDILKLGPADREQLEQKINEKRYVGRAILTLLRDENVEFRRDDNLLYLINARKCQYCNRDLEV